MLWSNHRFLCTFKNFFPTFVCMVSLFIDSLFVESISRRLVLFTKWFVSIEFSEKCTVLQEPQTFHRHTTSAKSIWTIHWHAILHSCTNIFTPWQGLSTRSELADKEIQSTVFTDISLTNSKRTKQNHKNRQTLEVRERFERYNKRIFRSLWRDKFKWH